MHGRRPAHRRHVSRPEQAKLEESAVPETAPTAKRSPVALAQFRAGADSRSLIDQMESSHEDGKWKRDSMAGRDVKTPETSPLAASEH